MLYICNFIDLQQNVEYVKTGDETISAHKIIPIKCNCNHLNLIYFPNTYIN